MGILASRAAAGASPRAVTSPVPVLVVGSSRSGTSVTAAALGLHPQVRLLPELHFVEHLWRPGDGPLGPGPAAELAGRLMHHARDGFYRPYRPDAHRADADAVAAALGPDADGPAVYRAVLDRVCDGRPQVVDQTPRYVYWIPELLGALPEARVVRLVRDPRDVLLSQKRWWRTLHQAAGDVPATIAVRHRLQYHPVLMSLLWRSAARAADRVTDPRVLTVRFEDLVADPEATLRRVCDHLGLTFDPAMLAVPRTASSNADTLHTGWGFDPGAVGRGPGALSPEELWLSQRIARDPAYPPVPVVLRPVRMLLLLARLPLQLLLVTALNLGRTRDVAGSVARRLGVRR